MPFPMLTPSRANGAMHRIAVNVELTLSGFFVNLRNGQRVLNKWAQKVCVSEILCIPVKEQHNACHKAILQSRWTVQKKKTLQRGMGFIHQTNLEYVKSWGIRAHYMSQEQMVTDAVKEGLGFQLLSLPLIFFLNQTTTSGAIQKKNLNLR